MYSVFPGLALRGRTERALVTLTWAAVAVLAVLGTAQQGKHVEHLLEALRKRRSKQRETAVGEIIPLLLKHHEFPPHYQFRLYILDPDRGELVSNYSPNGTESATAFKIGQGAVGLAWKERTPVTLSPPEIHDESTGITPEQQEHFRQSGLQIIVAMPVMNIMGDMLGILSGFSRNDDRQLTSASGHRKQQKLAQVIARVLVDLMADAEDFVTTSR
jgi:hypothetical protein